MAEQAKCCWITGVGDRILDYFCLALIGSILGLSVLISVLAVKSLGYWERFYFQNEMLSCPAFALFITLLLATLIPYTNSSVYWSLYMTANQQTVLTKLSCWKYYGHSVYGIWELENPCTGHCTFEGLIILFLMSKVRKTSMCLLSSVVYWRLTTDEQCSSVSHRLSIYLWRLAFVGRSANIQKLESQLQNSIVFLRANVWFKEVIFT